MRPSLHRLYEIARAPARTILGLMSGTSLDGLDMALCRIEGHGLDTRMTLLRFATASYPEAYLQQMRQVFSVRQADLELLTILHSETARLHAGLIREQLRQWDTDPRSIDLLASHGQTLYHAPKHHHGRADLPHATLQIGDGDHLAFLTGLITLSDFRQKHIAAGGEGAPLAAYGDYLLYRHPSENRVMLNIGGIANLTYLPAGCTRNEVLSSDIGPGNTLMDDLARQQGLPGGMDRDGACARLGDIHPALLTELKNHPFFKAPFPKTTGPELFNRRFLEEAIQQSDAGTLAVEDLMATLNRFTADVIAHAVTRCMGTQAGNRLWVSGGGARNPVLMDHLRRCLQQTPVEILPESDAKEAMLFAVLANEMIAGESYTQGGTEGPFPDIGMGKISLPD